jgi:hypothetical protein
MGKVIVVTSGKGGVGKTTSTAALGAALARAGKKVVVVDFDVGLRNLDIVMGAERRVVHDLINVVQGVVTLASALIRDKRIETLFLLPASQTRDKDALTEEGVSRVIAELRGMFDWVICDSPAGIERGATLAMRFAATTGCPPSTQTGNSAVGLLSPTIGVHVTLLTRTEYPSAGLPFRACQITAIPSWMRLSASALHAAHRTLRARSRMPSGSFACCSSIRNPPAPSNRASTMRGSVSAATYIGPKRSAFASM